MDYVLKPDLLWIGSTCYRLPPQNEASGLLTSKIPEPSDECAAGKSIELRPSNYYDCSDGPCEMDTTGVQKLQNGQFMLGLPIPKTFWGKLIGMKGSTKKRIEETTGTTITIPKPHQDGDVTVIGKTCQQVIEARTFIENMIHATRQSSRYTHFISIPAGKDIQTNFLKFKEKAQQLCPDIPELIFTIPAKLHLTLNCVLLVNNSEKRQACDILHGLKPEKLAGKKLEVVVQGLNIMNDDPSNSSVLFAKVKDINSLLQDIANESHSRFMTAGFMKERDSQHTPKLHLTLIKYNEWETAHGEPKRNDRSARQRGMDLRPILKELNDYYFGVISVDTIGLAIMSSYDSDGYYETAATIKF